MDCTLLVGKENEAADCLSRLTVNHIFEQHNLPFTFGEFAHAQHPHINTDILNFPSNSQIKLSKITIPDFSFPLLVDTILGIPRILLAPSLEEQIIKHYHSLNHPGINAPHRLIKSRFVCKNMGAKVSDFVRSCVGCQLSKTTCHVVSVKLPIAMPNSRFKRIKCDIAGPFPHSNGFSYIPLCIDLFTR